MASISKVSYLDAWEIIRTLDPSYETYIRQSMTVDFASRGNIRLTVARIICNAHRQRPRWTHHHGIRPRDWGLFQIPELVQNSSRQPIQWCPKSEWLGAWQSLPTRHVLATVQPVSRSGRQDDDRLGRKPLKISQPSVPTAAVQAGAALTLRWETLHCCSS